MAMVNFDEPGSNEPNAWTEARFQERVITDFTKRAPVYDTGMSGAMHSRWISQLLSFFPPAFPALDVACGTGMLAANASPEGRGFVNYDITPAMIEQARKSCPQSTCIVGPAEKLPFDDSSFKSVYVCSALVYFTSIPEFLREARRVLCKDGFLALQVSTGNSYIIGVVAHSVCTRMFGKERGEWLFTPPCTYTDTAEVTKRLLENHGFGEVHIEEVEERPRLSTEDIERASKNFIRSNAFGARLEQLVPSERERFENAMMEDLLARRGADNCVEDYIRQIYIRGRPV